MRTLEGNRIKLYEIYEYLTLIFMYDPTYTSYRSQKRQIWSSDHVRLAELAKVAMSSLKLIQRSHERLNLPSPSFVRAFFYDARKIYLDGRRAVESR